MSKLKKQVKKLKKRVKRLENEIVKPDLYTIDVFGPGDGPSIRRRALVLGLEEKINTLETENAKLKAELKNKTG